MHARTIAIRSIPLALLALFCAAGCTSTPAGAQGGPCFANKTCNQGLTCVGGACQRGDGGVPGLPDAAPLPDGYVLQPCGKPGAPCDAKDPCAIDPLCTADGQCRPAGLQRCDDGLACTADRCAGGGLCDHAVQAGQCVLPSSAGGKVQLACFAAGARAPDNACLECKPELDPRRWTPLTGGPCDDGEACTKEDACQNGVCQGTDYRAACTDGLSCTDDACDGVGGCKAPALQQDACLIAGVCQRTGDKGGPQCSVCDPAAAKDAWTLLAAFCVIDGACYKPAELSVSRCSVCDPATSASAWSPAPHECEIGGMCYKTGEAEPTRVPPTPATPTLACSVCDPAVSTTAFSLRPGTCKIDGTCYKAGDAQPVSRCAVCDPAASTTAWTPRVEVCRISGQCYAKGEPHPDGCAACDPTANPSAWTVSSPSACLIGGKCYAAGALDPLTGCSSCDPSKSNTAFSPLVDVCRIGGGCRKAGVQHVEGCAVCDPAQNAAGWTVTGTGTCLISDHCYAAGAKNPITPCLACNPDASRSAWTAAAGAVVAVHNFDATTAWPAGWSTVQSNPFDDVGWQIVPGKRVLSAPNAAWYGSVSTGTYASSFIGTNAGELTLSGVALPAGQSASLRFAAFLAVEATPARDRLEVYVTPASGTSQRIWQKQTASASWVDYSADLTPFAGKTVSITFYFDTVDANANNTEGVYLDDVTIVTGC